jgi:hypothetical protein
MLIEQDAPGGSFAPQLFVNTNWPEIVMLLIVTVVPPTLASVVV